jgi:transposase
VKMACELPRQRGVPVAVWDCGELARKLVESGVVTSISADTVRRVLRTNALKPWRWHTWLSPKVPRDATFAATVHDIAGIYTRALGPDEVVLCIDEKTSIQPRGRMAPTLPARDRQPVRVEQEYQRSGALNLFASFNTRTGEVIAWNAPQKRADEFVAFLELLDVNFPPTVRRIHLVLDNLRVHKGKVAQAWFAAHPRFVLHFPPVHCSWMNQVEQWFSIIERKVLRLADFDGTRALDAAIHKYVAHWNRAAHPFNWTTASVARVLAKCQTPSTVLEAA